MPVFPVISEGQTAHSKHPVRSGDGGVGDACELVKSRAPDEASGDGVAGGSSTAPGTITITSADDPDWR